MVEKLFFEYGPLKDASTHLPLFNQQNWKTAKQILELIQQGYVSDPPGIALYSIIAVDAKADNLPIYRCSRGTNFTEGGVHTHLRSRLPTSGASVRHVNACLTDFVLQHNIRVGTFNTTGKPYTGHFSIWTTNELQKRLVFLEDALVNPVHITGWVNGSLYLQTREQLGILPIPSDVRQSSGMAEFNISTIDRTQPHLYLARMQGTRKAILPVHTSAEHDLFRNLMKSNPVFNAQSSGPIWKLAVKVWNEFADKQTDIFYKLVEQLKVHYSAWEVQVNVKQTLSMSSATRNPLLKTARNPSRSMAAPTLPLRQLITHKPTKGFDTSSISHQPFGPGDHGHIAYNPLTTPSRDCTMPVVDYGPELPNSVSPTTDTPDTIMRTLVNYQMRADVAKTQPAAKPVKKRKRRTCAKCARPECSGSQKSSNCQNPCQDCNRTACQGRNSSRPTKPCNTPGLWDKY